MDSVSDTRNSEPSAAGLDPLLLDLHLCFDLQNTSRAFGDLYRDVLADTGLTYPQYLVMITLWEHHELSVKQLAQLLRLDSGTLSPLIKRLEAAGLVVKTRSAADERSVLVRPSPEGVALREKAERVPGAIQAAAGLTPREASALQDTLRRLAASLDSFEPSPARRQPNHPRRSHGEAPTSLNARLRAVNRARQKHIPADARAVMQRGARELAESGQAETALAVGAKAPSFVLPSTTGESVALEDLLSDGPVVLTFYRGDWCPYCNITMRSLQQHHRSITARGARLVAVSPETPDGALFFAEKNELDFDFLSDLGCATAEQFGIAFDLRDDALAAYACIDLQRSSLAQPRTLPIPATYVIDRDATIRWAFVDPDYTTRAEPMDIVAALDGIR